MKKLTVLILGIILMMNAMAWDEYNPDHNQEYVNTPETEMATQGYT